MKKGMLILWILAAAIMLTACGGTTEKSAVTATAVPLADKVKSAAAGTEELAELNAEDLSDVLGAEAEDYREFVFLQSDGMDGREILVIRAADKNAAEKLKGLAENYLERRLNETRNYAPEAYKLLSEAKVQTRNLTVALIAGPEAAKETDAILSGE